MCINFLAEGARAILGFVESLQDCTPEESIKISSGRLTSGEIKQLMSEKIMTFCGIHQDLRMKVTSADLEDFYAMKSMDIKSKKNELMASASN